MKTILADAYNTLVTADTGLSEAMVAMLDRFANPKLCLTNANDEQMDALGLRVIPYEIFTLAHSPEKTDPEYYRILLARRGWTPDDVVYFEHNAAAVESARSVGIGTYRYDKDARDLDALERFLVEALAG